MVAHFAAAVHVPGIRKPRHGIELQSLNCVLHRAVQNAAHPEGGTTYIYKNALLVRAWKKAAP
jgi:hypothetical protein